VDVHRWLVVQTPCSGELFSLLADIFPYTVGQGGSGEGVEANVEESSINICSSTLLLLLLFFFLYFFIFFIFCYLGLSGGKLGIGKREATLKACQLS